ncbi:LacI family DNA-binding transcriptional regulator [Treponema sp.]
MSTIKEVAGLAGVSIATVSYVINGTKKVSPETQRKVVEAIETLNYRVNHFAANMKTGKSGSVAFLAADLTNPFFLEVAVAIERTLRNAKYNLILANTDEKVNIEKMQVDNLINHAIDGLILTSSTGNHLYLKKMVPSSVPLVFFDRTPTNLQGDCVLSSNVEGAQEAIEYLISLGHHRIGLISGLRGLTTSSERESGYIDALAAHAIPSDPALILNGDGKKNSGYQLMQQLFEVPDLSAVFITNNSMALGALTFLHDNSIRIPEDLSIVIFDDYDWSTVHAPGLTAVKQDTDRLGSTVADVILRRLSGELPVDNFC